MGLSFGTLTKLLLGFGLGVLAVSCLVVTICFGGYANNYPSYLRIFDQLSFGPSTYSTTVAIAVLGCLATVAALAAFALSLLMEGQTIILIATGGAAAIFAFGCIVAEGVYTQQIVSSNSYYELTKYGEKNHQKAQKYITEAIKELYGQALTNFKTKGLDNLPDWESVEYKLKNDESYSYKNIWRNELNKADEAEESQISLYCTYNGLIKASYNYQEVEVASLRFYHMGSITHKNKVCWFSNKDKTDFKCKYIKDYEEKNEKVPINLIYASDVFLNEKILVGSYDKRDTDEYIVEDFPFAYKLLEPKDIDNDEESDMYNEKYLYEESSNHFKVSGKKIAKAYFNLKKKEYSNPDSDYVYIAPSEPKDMKDYYNKCPDGEDNEFCGQMYINYILRYIQKNYKDDYKGKTSPAVKKYYNKEERKILSEKYRDPDFLYPIALINLIIQIISILLWACGRFLGLILGGGSDEKTPSDGEA